MSTKPANDGIVWLLMGFGTEINFLLNDSLAMVGL
jgi:hypothetical protein